MERFPNDVHVMPFILIGQVSFSSLVNKAGRNFTDSMSIMFILLRIFMLIIIESPTLSLGIGWRI